MKKLFSLLAFSILLLVPIGAQQVFGTHAVFTCPPNGILNTVPTDSFNGNPNFCVVIIGSPPNCPAGFSPGTMVLNGVTFSPACGAPAFIPGPTLPGSCQNGAVLDANDHCVPDLNFICSTGTIPSGLQCIAQAASSMIGGVLLDINTMSLLVGVIGVNPVITGLVGITLAGVTIQAAWFIHKKINRDFSIKI